MTQEPEKATSAAGEAPKAHCPIRNRWLRRLGAGAFLFFLIKGLLWLIVPAALAVYAAMR